VLRFILTDEIKSLSSKRQPGAPARKQRADRFPLKYAALLVKFGFALARYSAIITV